MDDKSEVVLDAFIAQFYMNKPIPKNIYVNKNLPNKGLLESGLGERANSKVSIFLPQRGEKTYDGQGLKKCSTGLGT